MSMRLNSGLLARKSSINGPGCFAAVAFARWKKVGELIGERIPNRVARSRVARGGKVRICEIDRDWSIDASREETQPLTLIIRASQTASAG